MKRLVLTLLLLLIPTQTLALTDAQRHRENFDSVFFDENGRSGSCSGGAVPISADIPTATVNAINSLKDDYVAAAEAVQIPWQILAALDYRENGNDPNLSTLSGEPIGTTNPDSGVTTSSKADSVKRAAQTIKNLAAELYGIQLTNSSQEGDIKSAFLAYNRGVIYKRAGVNWDVSPYVMNQADSLHINMKWPNIPGEPLAGTTEYDRLGAWTLYERLGGSGAVPCNANGGSIVDIALQQLGLKEVPNGCDCGPEIQKFLGSSNGEEWCADFVSWVYNQAKVPFTGGLDGGWRLPGVSGVEGWLSTNGAFDMRGAADKPQPGDVVIFADQEHTGIVESIEGTTLNTIEGNTSNMVARRSYTDYENNAQVRGWGRIK